MLKDYRGGRSDWQKRDVESAILCLRGHIHEYSLPTSFSSKEKKISWVLLKFGLYTNPDPQPPTPHPKIKSPTKTIWVFGRESNRQTVALRWLKVLYPRGGAFTFVLRQDQAPCVHAANNGLTFIFPLDRESQANVHDGLNFTYSAKNPMQMNI